MKQVLLGECVLCGWQDGKRTAIESTAVAICPHCAVPVESFTQELQNTEQGE
ncbi:hypothetical protein [Dethiobacter alkaliphilus]|uniref:Uncharacterized protein n=1 Tax=Dethiobacter alkaliphilus AHT 1 TaxID=555088 RepID=C0GK30_DETAL|nr:hypothetical protein [Dethiobacter alkaliphilus]EEG76300.1 hypothetical protein DealDRAFT_2839 [Dethiobacter alkaliphilus AHT 1]